MNKKQTIVTQMSLRIARLLRAFLLRKNH